MGTKRQHKNRGKKRAENALHFMAFYRANEISHEAKQRTSLLLTYHKWNKN